MIHRRAAGGGGGGIGARTGQQLRHHGRRAAAGPRRRSIGWSRGRRRCCSSPHCAASGHAAARLAGRAVVRPPRAGGGVPPCAVQVARVKAGGGAAPTVSTRTAPASKLGGLLLVNVNTSTRSVSGSNMNAHSTHLSPVRAQPRWPQPVFRTSTGSTAVMRLTMRRRFAHAPRPTAPALPSRLQNGVFFIVYQVMTHKLCFLVSRCAFPNI